MTTEINVALLVAIIGCLIAIAGYVDSRRKAAILEGKQQQLIDQLRADLARAFEKIHTLERCTQTSEQNNREILTDIRWIRESIGEIKERLASMESDGK
jgi:recombinational DNA repair protein RecR